jgi:hypothetical protein
MKLLIIILVYFGLIKSWFIELKISNNRMVVLHKRRWYIRIVSDMGGEVKTDCQSGDYTNYKCENAYQVTSSQGGYFIRDFKCRDIHCEVYLETEGISFTIDINCKRAFDMSSELRLSDQDYAECFNRRDFSLDYDGNVHYHETE